MKKALTIIFLIFTFLAKGQFGTKAVGYFISNRNDTVRTHFYVDYPQGMLQNFAYSIKYVDSNNKQQALKPELAKEVYFVCNGEKMKLVSMEFPKYLYPTKTFGFFQVIDESGYLKEYYCSWNKLNWEVFQKGNDTLHVNSSVHYREKLAQYFSDCPEIVTQIKNKEHRSTLEFVKEYNRSCAVKQ